VGAISGDGATAFSTVTGAVWTAAVDAIVANAAGVRASLAAERRSSVRCRRDSTRPSSVTSSPLDTGVRSGVTCATAGDLCLDAGPDPSEDAVGPAVLVGAASAGRC
jgi:hypothetical protein